MLIVTAGLLVWWRFESDIVVARDKAAFGSTVIETPCGLIEYQQAGSGKPLLAVHGSGGGYDQGMAFAAPLATRGIRVIAMSRFGYLRTPMPNDASAEAQADAFICLMDALNIPEAAVIGGSAGALSALQMAIRYPDRTTALILLVPLGYKPPSAPDSASPMAPWVEKTMMKALGSDFLFWAVLHVARAQMIGSVLATHPELVTSASAAEHARINAMLDNILPVSARAAGLRSDTKASKTMVAADLSLVVAPTLIISARDDRYGTFASAEYMAGKITNAQFLGFETGGHTWLGHNDAVMDAIAGLILPVAAGAAP